MHAGLADQIVNERHLIHDRAEVRHRLAEHLAALAVRLEVPHRLEPRTEPVLKRLHLLAKIARLAVPLDEFRLEVEQVEMARRARHEELHHALRLCRMMQRAPEHAGRNSSEQLLAAEQSRERDTAEAAPALPEEVAPGQRGAAGGLVEGRFVIHDSRLPYFIECSPIRFPSVSFTSAMKPYCPIENFSLKIAPPAGTTRAASAAQSSQEK